MPHNGRPRAAVLTDTELEVMHTFWAFGDLTVVESQKILSLCGHAAAVTTVATLIRHLIDKRFLEQVNNRQPRRFRATMSFHEVSGRLLADFIDRVYAGSRTPLLVRLVREVSLTDELRERLEQLLDGRDSSLVAQSPA